MEIDEKITKFEFFLEKRPTFESDEIFEIEDHYFDGIIELNAVVRSDYKSDTRICTFCEIIRPKVRISVNPGQLRQFTHRDS